VDHSVELLQASSTLVLDTDGSLQIAAVSLVKDAEATTPLQYSFGARDAVFGVPLVVQLPEGQQAAGSKLLVRLAYTTAPTAGAIQWLPPEQTKGGKHPYLFTQASDTRTLTRNSSIAVLLCRAVLTFFCSSVTLLPLVSLFSPFRALFSAKPSMRALSCPAKTPLRTSSPTALASRWMLRSAR
jgi:hypothetical protein